MRPAFRSPLILLLAVAAWSCSDSIPTQAPEEMESEGPGLPDVSGIPVSSDVLTDFHGPPGSVQRPHGSGSHAGVQHLHRKRDGGQR